MLFFMEGKILKDLEAIFVELDNLSSISNDILCFSSWRGGEDNIFSNYYLIVTIILVKTSFWHHLSGFNSTHWFTLTSVVNLMLNM